MKLILPALAALALATAPCFARIQDEAAYSSAFWGLDTDGRRTAAYAWAEAEPDNDRALAAAALFAWQLDQDTNRALRFLETGLTSRPDSGRLLHLQGRIFASTGAHEAALRAYDSALRDQPDEADLRYHRARLLLDMDRTEESMAALHETLQHAPAHLHACLLLIDLAVETGRYDQVAPIWQAISVVGYARTDTGGPSAIENWQALAGRTDTASHRMRGALLETWHHYAAAALEYERGGDTAKAADMRAVARYEREIAQVMNDYYRDRALNGAREEDSLAGRLLAPVNTLSAALQFEPVATAPGDELRERMAARMEQFDTRFGWLTLVGATNGRLDLHFGHIVSSGLRPIEQWGQQTEVDSITLFNMPSNGFSRWFWDDHAADGGWISTGDDGRPTSRRFIDVLDPKFGAALHRSALVDQNERRGEIDAEWRAALAERITGYDRRVNDRLRLRALETVEAGLDPDAALTRREAAINAIVDHFVSTSTVIHEGQHILDTQNGFTGDQWLLEYRAKLTELAYGEFPFLSLDGFYSPASLGGQGGTPHADAEIYLMRALAETVRQNPDDYPSINPELDPLAQLPGLSVAELRHAARILFAESETAFARYATEPAPH